MGVPVAGVAGEAGMAGMEGAVICMVVEAILGISRFEFRQGGVLTIHDLQFWRPTKPAIERNIWRRGALDHQWMSVTAKQLSKSGARGKDLETIVHEQLSIIDSKLRGAERTWGRNVVACELPMLPALPGLDKKDAQRIVYSMILRSLDEREFDTKILLENERTVVYIAWMTDLDAKEVEAMNALIRNKRIQRTEVNDFIQHGSLADSQSASAVRAGRAEPPRPMVVTEKGRVMRPRGGVMAPAAPMPPPVAPAGASTEVNGVSAAEVEIMNAIGS